MSTLIKRIRQHLRMSQADMAKRLGVSVVMISMYERNKKSPYKKLDAILELADEAGLEVSCDEIINIVKVENG